MALTNHRVVLATDRGLFISNVITRATVPPRVLRRVLSWTKAVFVENENMTVNFGTSIQKL